MQAALFTEGLDPAVPHHAEITVSYMYTGEDCPTGSVRIGAIMTA